MASTDRDILIVDDDAELTRLLGDFFAGFGIAVRAAHSGGQGLRELRRRRPDLVILDVMLPDDNGFELCKAIRGQGALPIIMLSARGDVFDRILGLELGADDYLPKPFEPRELLARIESVLRRQSASDEVIEAGDLRLHLAAEEARLKESRLDLSHLEFRCLAYLARNRHRVLTRDLLLAELRGLDWELDNRSVDILISRLRRKLADNPQRPTYIATIRGSGYRFIA